MSEISYSVGMMSPNFGEASSSMEQPPVFDEPEGKFVQDPNSSGLIVPESYARDKAAQLQVDQQIEQNAADANQAQTEVSENADNILRPEDGEEKNNVPQLTEQRAEVIKKAIEELKKTRVTEATSEEDAIDKIAEITAANGGNVEKEKARARRWLDRASALAGMTFNEFKAANEGSSLQTFLDAFLVFGVEGRFGGTSIDSLRGNIKEGTDDAYLDKVLSKGDPKILVEFFQDVLDDSNLENLDEIKDLISTFNSKAKLNKEDLDSRMAKFLNEKDSYRENRSFVGIYTLFSRLEGLSPEKILKYFKIDPDQETAAESG